MAAIKVRPIGNSLGVILNSDILQKLRVSEGDELFVAETPTGIELSPYNPEIAAQLDIAESVMRDNREVLRKLAK